MSKKRALVLLADQNQSAKWIQALADACGKRILATCVPSLGGLYATLKEETVDLLIVGLDIPTSDTVPLNEVDSLQLIWFLRRRYPELVTIISAADSQHQQAAIRAGASAFLIVSPELSLQQCAQEVRQMMGIAPEDPQDRAWWLRPEWVLTLADGSLALSRNCEDTEIRCDLSDFLSLKARQLDQALLGEGWASVTVKAENASLELFQLSEGHRALCISEGSWSDDPLTPEIVESLRNMDLYEEDHAVP